MSRFSGLTFEVITIWWLSLALLVDSTIVHNCLGVRCPFGHRCVSSPKACFVAPCPQYDCISTLPSEDLNCQGIICPSGQSCVSSPQNCLVAPCPQYDCVSILPLMNNSTTQSS
uniref:(California timema) hypothetical protein n=1 Tax=Timema californicum TaxID=61474 RepID=A0A7R9P624_TIMCA|nr:unnamed protein product [Timema californicum]